MVAFICCYVQVFGAQGSLLGSIVVANLCGVLLLSQVFGAQGSLLVSIACLQNVSVTVLLARCLAPRAAYWGPLC